MIFLYQVSCATNQGGGADAFEVSMDYLVGEGVNVSFDKKNLKRLQDIEKLDDATKDKLYFVIDNILQNFKAKKAYAS